MSLQPVHVARYGAGVIAILRRDRPVAVATVLANSLHDPMLANRGAAASSLRNDCRSLAS